MKRIHSDLNEEDNMENLGETLQQCLNISTQLAEEDELFPLVNDINFKLDQLMEVDQKLCQSARLAVAIPGNMADHRITEHDLIVSGSCAEGCMLARWFRDTPKYVPYDVDFLHEEEVRKYGKRRQRGRPVSAKDIMDIVIKFLEGPGKEKADPERIRNLILVAGPLLQMITGAPTAGAGTSTTGESNQTTVCDESMENLNEHQQVPTRTLDHPLPGADPWEIEIDILGKLGTIPKSCKKYIEPVEGKPVHVVLPYCEALKACIQPVIWQKIEKERLEGMVIDLETNGYFDPFKIKKAIGILSVFRDSDKNLPLVLGWVFGIPAKDVKVSVHSETTKTTHQFTFNAQLTEYFSMNLARFRPGMDHSRTKLARSKGNTEDRGIWQPVGTQSIRGWRSFQGVQVVFFKGRNRLS